MKILRNLTHFWFVMLFALAGCSGGSGTPTPERSPAPTATRADPASTTPNPTMTPTSGPVSPLGVKEENLRGLHIRFWYSGPEALSGAMDAQVSAFNAANPEGIQVEASYYGSFGSLTDAVQGAVAGQGPDAALDYLALTSNWTALPGQPVNLIPYLNDPVYGLTTADRDDYPEGTFPAAASENGLRGLPGYRSGSFLYYNQSWAVELGFKQAPNTPDEFRQQACAAAKANEKVAAEKRGTGGWIASRDADATLSWIAAFGGKSPAGGTGQDVAFDPDATKQAFTYLKGLFDQSCAWVARSADPTDYFANRQALFYSGSAEDVSQQEAAFNARKSSDHWTLLPYPSLDGGGIVFGNGPDYVVLPGTPEHQLAAWLLIRSLSSAESQARLAAASGVLPVRLSSVEKLGDSVQKHPQWGEAVKWAAKMQMEPSQPAWLQMRPILEDASGQLYQVTTKPDQITTIMDMLDTTIQEVLGHTP